MNRKANRIISGTLAASVLTSSCVNPYSNNESIYGEMSQNEDAGIAAISLSLSLSKTDKEYLSFIDKLGNDIIKNPSIAREFMGDPTAYLRKYGFDQKIDLDEGMLKLILALGDEEINQMIVSNDVTGFVHLLAKKNLLNPQYLKISLSDSDKQELSKFADQLQIDPGNESGGGGDGLVCTLAAVCVVYVALGVASFVAVMATLGVTINVSAAMTVVYTVAAYTEVKVRGVSRSELKNSIAENNPVFKIWGLKGNTTNTFIAVDKYIEREVASMIETLEVLNPNLFNNISKEKLSDFLKLNIVMQ
jgi:hypothetical protein